MTDDTNRQNELKKMELCDSCAGVQRNWRKAPGHPELVQGDNRHETRRHGLVAITSYRCDRCGTRWEYENDKTNPCRLVSCGQVDKHGYAAKQPKKRQAVPVFFI